MKRIQAMRVVKIHDGGYSGDDYLGQFTERVGVHATYVDRARGELRDAARVLARGKGVAVDRHDCRYFLPSRNHVPHNPESWAHVGAKEKCQVVAQYGSLAAADHAYALQDWQRAEALCRGQWCYLGIRAEAEVRLSQDGRHWLTQRLSSPGLWGIESDADPSHFEEVAREELHQLRWLLMELGFQADAIEAAMPRTIEFVEP